MLKYLEIRNYVLVDRLKINFSDGFNVITGETGAGKSIIIGALELICGDKGSTRHVGALDDKLIVNSVFDISGINSSKVKDKISSLGIKLDDNTLTIRREITKQGKSRSFINYTSVRVADLKNISSLLVDIHGQHEHQSLFDIKNHIKYYDTYIGAHSIKKEYADKYSSLVSLIKQYNEIVENKNTIEKERSFLEFVVKEIIDADIKDSEDELIKNDINVMSNFEEIASNIKYSYDEVYGDEDSITSRLSKVIGYLDQVKEYDNEIANISSLFEDIMYKSDDIRERLTSLKSRINFSPEKLNELNERLFMLNNLKKKYGDGKLSSVLEYYNESKEKLNTLNFSDDDIINLKNEISSTTIIVSKLAKQLSDIRKSSKDKFTQLIEKETTDLSMEGTRFDVEIISSEDENGIIEIDGVKYAATESGIDNIEFLIAPNKGELFYPLRRIASGGEISRIMLALKTVLSEGDFSETMIFDEIDSGVGGRIAEVIGEKIKGLAVKKQVMAITHLAQISVHSKAHFKVSKYESEGRVVSDTIKLNETQRINEVARMLGGKNITDTTISHAKEMLVNASRSSRK